MKTGLVTFHAAHHYGAMLQACALAKTVAGLAGGCELIDYVRPDTLEGNTVFQKGFSPAAAARNLHSLLSLSALRLRYDRFETFMREAMQLSPKRYLTLAELRAEPPEYDVYISGSDQIWNPFIFKENRFDLSFFSAFAKSGRRIAYAPSFGSAAIDGAVADELRGLVRDFSHLSAREAAGAEILEKVSGRGVPVVLDPTLLLTREEWGAAAGERALERPYLLAYFVSPPELLSDAARRVKKRMGVEAVQLAGTRRRMPGADRMVFDAGPREFISLFQNASFVLTNSFHGAVFSILFQKPFICGAGSGEDGRVSRTGNLLGLLGMEPRLDGGEVDLSDIDYGAVEARLRSERERSLLYLQNALEGTG
ncbi:MAG: polysaccharide pyruvyl transferase family protein [Oscillospiraceae bacterium]|nr:polysaccharide pyruvyl transferase family protein [Oscillospiraceae bacterium]